MRTILRSTYKPMPWKNGLGQTAEIDREPMGEGPYLWRLSQAEITGDCAFSTFAGYDRWLAVWQGGGLYLNQTRLEPLTPWRFSGDDATSCRLVSEKVMDLGLIFDRSKLQAEMQVVAGPLALAGGVHYLFDLQSGDTRKVQGALDLEVDPSFLISVRAIRERR